MERDQQNYFHFGVLERLDRFAEDLKMYRQALSLIDRGAA